jgi:hypothetical protein
MKNYELVLNVRKDAAGKAIGIVDGKPSISTFIGLTKESKEFGTKPSEFITVSFRPEVVKVNGKINLSNMSLGEKARTEALIASRDGGLFSAIKEIITEAISGDMVGLRKIGEDQYLITTTNIGGEVVKLELPAEIYQVIQQPDGTMQFVEQYVLDMVTGQRVKARKTMKTMEFFILGDAESTPKERAMLRLAEEWCKLKHLAVSELAENAIFDTTPAPKVATAPSPEGEVIEEATIVA